MLATISPIWDGNETWLVIAGATLFGAFPLVYSTLLSAFYLPITLMLIGLILRGVAFEFRYKTTRLRSLWDAGFVIGSYAAGFIQGTAVGAIVEGLAIDNGRYVGGPFAWVSPFAVLCGLGLCIGYALAGSCWLAGKGSGQVRTFGFAVLPWLMAALVLFLLAAFSHAVLLDLPVFRRWNERPILVLFPLIGLCAFIVMGVGVWKKYERFLFASAATIFAAAFLTLAVSFLPYMVPFTITIAEAAAPESSLSFLFWGAGVIVLPITLIYTGIVYFIFRGKVTDDVEYD